MPLGNLTSTLADAFGGSSSTYGWLIAVCAAQAMGLGVYIATRSMIACLVATGVALLLASFMGFVPIWVCFIFFAMGGLMLLFNGYQSFGLGSSQTTEAKGEKQSNKNPVELVLRIEKESQKWAEYHNNLDKLLGTKTCETPVSGLVLSSNLLETGRDYDWYIAGKMPAQDVFKIVGLHKKEAEKNKVYLLGKDKETNKAFLTQLSSSHLEDNIEKCVDAKRGNETNGLMVGMLMTAIGQAIMPALMEGIVSGADTKGVKQ